MVHVIQLASRIRTKRPDPARKLSANLYDIYHCCVYSEKPPDDGQRNCPKHVEFYSKNKFEELVHLVGFIIRIYHDARSPERQKLAATFEAAEAEVRGWVAKGSVRLLYRVKEVVPFDS